MSTKWPVLRSKRAWDQLIRRLEREVESLQNAVEVKKNKLLDLKFREALEGHPKKCPKIQCWCQNDGVGFFQGTGFKDKMAD